MKKMLLVCLLAAGVVGCSQGGPELIPKSDRSPATEIDASFMNAPNTDLAKLKGQVVVLDFWATWCGPCRMEIPSFVKLYPVYHPKGMEMIGLSVEAPNSQPEGYFKQFLQNFNINYPMAFSSEATTKAYGISSIPATYFIDKNGKVAAVFVGVHPEAEIQGTIEKLLAE